jgi:hypothetical protein
MEISPKRFCSDACKMDAYALRRVSKLLEEVSDERVLEILREKKVQRGPSFRAKP